MNIQSTPKGLRFVIASSVFGVVTAVFAIFAIRSEVLYDTDSYFHLGVAQLYGQLGITERMEWTRFSVMRDGFGDKEFLFHLGLVPFTKWIEPALGGRLALALLVGAATALVAWIGFRAIGKWSALLPVLFIIGSQDVADRLVRLRPELLALMLFLLAAEVASRGRYRTLGAIALLFTLSYTAFHALLLLCCIWLVGRLILHSRWEPGLILYPVLGAGLGLIIHPHFPHNLVIWKIQSFDFFGNKAALDVGGEIQPALTSTLLWNNFGWVAALAVLLLSLRGSTGAELDDSASDRDLNRSVLMFGSSALVFCTLSLLMHRFTIYAVPFTLLAASFEAARRHLKPSRTVTWPDRAIKIPTVLALVAVLAIPAARMGKQLFDMATASGGQLTQEDDLRALSAKLPPGARVAVNWGTAHWLTFFAPQALYLNVLDPVFMALIYPDEYSTLQRVLDGTEPDIRSAMETLDSEYLVISRFHPQQRVVEDLRSHPALDLIYDGYTLLFRIRSRRAMAKRRWVVSPPQSQPPVAAIDPSWPSFDQNVGDYVDLSYGDGDCALISTAGPQAPHRFEVAPWGPTEIWIEDQRVLTVATPLRRTPGRGLDLELPAGSLLTVWTCRDPQTGRRGFSLRQLGP